MQAQQLIGGNFCLAKAGLTGLSGAANTFTTANAILYSNTGKALTKAAVSGGAMPTVDAVTGNPMYIGAGFGHAVLFCLDAAGNVAVAMGERALLDASGKFQFAAPQFATLPDTLTPFAYAIIKNAPGSAVFQVGVSNWNQTGATVTTADLIAIPNRPQLA